jgi:hypothetical protein
MKKLEDIPNSEFVTDIDDDMTHLSFMPGEEELTPEQAAMLPSWHPESTKPK